MLDGVHDPIRVLLVEDHAFTRDALRVAINHTPGLRVVGEARSGEESLEVLTRTPTDVLVLDIGLPGMDGIETARLVKTARPSVRIVMLTAHSLREEVYAALASGADAYCLKSADPTLLLLAIQAAAAGSAYLDPDIAHLVLGGVRSSGAIASPLSEREVEVLRLVADGLSNKEIARHLDVSVSTVKVTLQSVLEKLSASDRTQAAVKALRQGLL